MPKPFHFICGNDPYLVRERGREVWAKLSEGLADDFAIETIDGGAGNLEEVTRAVSGTLAAVRTLPMFGGAKAVWLKDVSFLADTPTGRAEGTLQRLEHLTEGLASINPDEVRLLLTACPVDRRKKGFKALQKLAAYEFLDTGKDGTAVVERITAEALKLGLRFEGHAAEVLVETVQQTTGLAIEETRKLAAYLNFKGDITEELVASHVAAFGEGDFFGPAEDFFSGDLRRVLSGLRKHFFAGNDARPLLASLFNRGRLLIQLRALLDSGGLPARPSAGALEKLKTRYGEAFGPAIEAKTSSNVFSQNPWYLGRLAETARHFDLPRLQRVQRELSRAFEGIIARPHEQEAVLREAALKAWS